MMKSNRAMGLYSALTITLLAGGEVASAESRTKKGPPNIVVIMADDLGWKDLHCYGNELVDTPHLDQLAREGMLFTNAYAAAAVCSPTRAAMMTGQAPARLHLTNHAPGHKAGFTLKESDLEEALSVRNLALSYETVAETLEKQGYQTAHVGKWHLSYVSKEAQEKGASELALRPEHQGFELNVGGCYQGGPPSYFAPYRIPALKEKAKEEYLPERLADEAIEFVKTHREKPFYLNWWPYSVHYPMEAKEELIAKYKKRKGPGIKNPIYAAMTEAMDTEIGRFLTVLDEQDLRENTLVIFNSDNGGYDGDNRPLRGFKGLLYEGGIRVPWIVRWPGKVEAGTVCETPVISMDCYATMLEAAEVDEEKWDRGDGLSLMPLLRQKDSWPRKALYWHYPNYAFHLKNRLGGVVREGDYKLIKRYGDGSLELYNLKDDLGEKKNLSEERPELAKGLEGKLDAWLKKVGANMPVRSAERE